MSDEIVFYTNPASRGRIVRWMLEEVAKPYRTELIDYPTMKGPEYLAVNPMGKVPAIVHGDVVVTEGAAICAYLADAFPEAGLAPPPGDKRRGTYFRWMFFASGPLESAVIAKTFGWETPPDRRRTTGWGSMEDVVNALELALEGKDYILGDRFSAVDVYLGAQIAWTLQFGALEKRPAFERYVARIQSRPASIRAKEIDDTLIAQQQSQTAA
jgi:glutathione S-transferase